MAPGVYIGSFQIRFRFPLSGHQPAGNFNLACLFPFRRLTSPAKVKFRGVGKPGESGKKLKFRFVPRLFQIVNHPLEFGRTIHGYEGL